MDIVNWFSSKDRTWDKPGFEDKNFEGLKIFFPTLARATMFRIKILCRYFLKSWKPGNSPWKLALEKCPKVVNADNNLF